MKRQSRNGHLKGSLPFNEDGEKGLLCSLLLAPGRVTTLCLEHHINSGWFFIPANMILFDTIATWPEPAKPVDFLWLRNALQTDGQLEEVGGKEAINELYSFVPTAEAALHYIGLLSDAYVRREAIKLCTKTAERCLDRAEDPRLLVAGMLKAGEQIHGLNGASRKPFLTVRSPFEIKQYEPPKDLVLVGDNHFVRGDVSVIGGPPGVGKSRLLVALAQSGATKKEWLGYAVHTKFRTLIIQNENGLLRLQRELADINEPKLDDYLRISEPPPYGMCFRRQEFRDQLRRICEHFNPQLVGLDPWNAVAQDDKVKDYLETFEVVREVFPPGDKGPCLVIVAHTRKPQMGDRANGRALMNLLAGSYVLLSVPRTIFILQHATDAVTEDKVVVTCPKNNNGQEGPRGAWIRRNGLFEEVRNFDWDEWDAGGKESPKGRLFTPQRVAEILTDFPKGLPKQKLVKELVGLGASVPTAYRAIDEAKKAGAIKFQKGTDSYVPIEAD